MTGLPIVAWQIRDTTPGFGQPGPWAYWVQPDEPCCAWTHHEKQALCDHAAAASLLSAAQERIATLERDGGPWREKLIAALVEQVRQRVRAEELRAALESIVEQHSGYCEHHVSVSKHSYNLAHTAEDALHADRLSQPTDHP